MKDLLISLDSNILKVSYCGPEGCAGFSQEMPLEIVQDTQIVDAEKFTEKLIDLSSSLLPLKKKPDALSFLVGSQDVTLAFLTVNKGGNTIEEQLVEAAVSKIDIPLEDLYFSYTKIAPFVYQFIGIKKAYMDSLLEVANLWGVPIKSVVPWVLLLPKTLKESTSAIFVGSFENKHTVALSELNGIYFSSSYDEKKTDKELAELVKQLSFYNRATPIRSIYTINSTFSIGDSYQVHPILEKDNYFEQEGFETHDLLLKVMKGMPDLLNSQVNLLNLLPLPAVKSKSGILASISAVILLTLLVGGYFFFFKGDSESPATLVPTSDDVLSETSTASSQVEAPSTEAPAQTETAPNGKVYTKKDLVIRVENASEVNGAAARTKTLLEGLGFKVESVGTAPNQLELTQVLITENLMDLKGELKQALGDNIPIEVVDVLDELDSSSKEEGYTHNVLIRLGKNSSI